MNYWLVKTEPDSYSLEDLKSKGEDVWDGVRNHQARNFIEKMKPGDLVFVYHSGKQRALVGTAKVVGAPYPDPKAADGERWLAVDIKYNGHLPNPVTLSQIKTSDQLNDLLLVRQSRLSVMSLTKQEADILVTMADA
jgi:predicted RNA-binding protein with PUA-like domain